MNDFSELKRLIDETRNACRAGNSDLAEKVGWELVEVFERDYHVTEDEYTPEVAKIQYEAYEALMELHILRGDPIDIAIRQKEILKKFKEDKKHLSRWSDEDWKLIVPIVFETFKRTQDFFKEAQRENVNTDKSCKCALCKRNLADKTGSHMVPHFIIANVFTYDKSEEREKVVLESEDLSMGEKEHYFGHQVYDDTISELIGKSLDDDEIAKEIKKKNLLTRDYVFCSECEKRFGTIESYYAEILTSGKNDYQPGIPYLFWMSVIWRMSISNMGTKLSNEHEDKLRKVLNNCLALKREETVVKKSKLGYCAYELYYTKDTRDEKLAIMGSHSMVKPYVALMGKYYLRYFMSVNAAKVFNRKLKLPEETLNDGTSPEVISDMSFLEFWQVKRQILDMAWKEDLSVRNKGIPGVSTISQYSLDDCGFGELMGIDYQESFDDINNLAWYLLYSDNPKGIVFPRSIVKILTVMKKKPDADIEEIASDTGYSKEEIATMLAYWDERVKDKNIPEMD